MDKDTRWIQRLNNYKKAFSQLEKGVELSKTNSLSDLEKEGVIQRFEYTQELAWKTIKDFYEYVGEQNIQGSADAFRMAYQKGLITKGEVFMKTIQSRNSTVHTYDEDTVSEIFEDIVDLYYDAFKDLLTSLVNQKEIRNL